MESRFVINNSNANSAKKLTDAECELAIKEMFAKVDNAAYWVEEAPKLFRENIYIWELLHDPYYMNILKAAKNKSSVLTTYRVISGSFIALVSEYEINNLYRRLYQLTPEDDFLDDKHPNESGQLLTLIFICARTIYLQFIEKAKPIESAIKDAEIITEKLRNKEEYVYLMFSQIDDGVMSLCIETFRNSSHLMSLAFATPMLIYIKAAYDKYYELSYSQQIEKVNKIIDQYFDRALPRKYFEETWYLVMGNLYRKTISSELVDHLLTRIIIDYPYDHNVGALNFFLRSIWEANTYCLTLSVQGFQRLTDLIEKFFVGQVISKKEDYLLGFLLQQLPNKGFIHYEDSLPLRAMLTARHWTVVDKEMTKSLITFSGRYAQPVNSSTGMQVSEDRDNCEFRQKHF